MSSIPDDKTQPSNTQAIGSKLYRGVNQYTSNKKLLEKILSTVAVIKHNYCILFDINNATLSETITRRLPLLG